MENKENKLIEDDQQFWYNASTHDYEDESKATGKRFLLPRLELLRSSGRSHSSKKL